MCNPPTPARYVSVDIDANQLGVRNKTVLTLCEVMVDEYPVTEPPAVLTSEFICKILKQRKTATMINEKIILSPLR